MNYTAQPTTVTRRRQQALLSKGLINIDEGDPSGWTPLIVASNRGFSPAVQVLLDGGANISIASDGGFTAPRRSRWTLGRDN